MDGPLVFVGGIVAPNALTSGTSVGVSLGGGVGVGPPNNPVLRTTKKSSSPTARVNVAVPTIIATNGGPGTYIQFGPWDRKGYKGDFLTIRELRGGELRFEGYHRPEWPSNA